MSRGIKVFSVSGRGPSGKHWPKLWLAEEAASPSKEVEPPRPVWDPHMGCYLYDYIGRNVTGETGVFGGHVQSKMDPNPANH